MTVVEWLLNVFDIPLNSYQVWFFYILAGAILLVLLDAIISLFFGAFSSLTRGGKK